MKISNATRFAAGFDEVVEFSRIENISKSSNKNPYRQKSNLDRIGGRLKDSITWRFNYAISRVRPYKSWYLAASLWPLLMDYGSRSFQLHTLKVAVDKQLDSSGLWKYPLDTAYKFLFCTHVVKLFELTGDGRYLNAILDALGYIEKMKRAPNGAFLYTPTSDEILVDTLGMICPFLSACVRVLGDQNAFSHLKEQIQLYWDNNMDDETSLPYHGYYSGGANKLGNLGWGRGVGWYMLALSSAQNTGKVKSDFNKSCSEWNSRILNTLVKYQRSDGHWSEFVLIKSRADSSATSMIILALASDYSNLENVSNETNKLLRDVIEAGRAAIIRSIGKNGLIQNSTGEAPGLGSYSHAYGNFPWSQGFGVAALIRAESWLKNNQS